MEGIQSQVSIPGNILVYPILVQVLLCMYSETLTQWLTEKWQTLPRWAGGDQILQELGSYIPGAGTIRVFGGDPAHSPVGRSLVRGATEVMASRDWNNTVVLVYESATEAFAVEAVLWQLWVTSGFPGREAEFVGPMAHALREKALFVGKNAVERWDGITILFRRGLTQADMQNAPDGAGSITATPGATGSPRRPDTQLATSRSYTFAISRHLHTADPELCGAGGLGAHTL